MQRIINTKELRASLPQIVEGVKRGEYFTVLYRSRPAFRIVPIEESDRISCPLSKDSLYGAGPVGESSDRSSAVDHDVILYGNSDR